MKPPPFAYHAPADLDTTLEVLAELGEDGKVLAGGQSLVPMLNFRLVSPRALVDIGRVAALDQLEVTDDHVRVGAGVTHARLERDAEVAAALPLLRQALRWVAHPVIRNRGTAVGSLVHADPAAELPAVLALVDGEVELRSTGGVRSVGAGDYLLGPLESDTRPEELATAAVFPRLPPRTGTAVLELARRHGDYAVAGVAVRLTLDEDHRVSATRATFLGVSPVPATVDLGSALAGQPHDALRTADAVAQAGDAIAPQDDIHASASYRRHLAGVLLGRALATAAHDAARAGRGTGEGRG